MTSYYDVKKTLCEILKLPNVCDIGEDDDINIPTRIRKRGGDNHFETVSDVMVLKNDVLKNAYEEICNQSFRDMELYSDTEYEVAVSCRWVRQDKIQISDPENAIIYFLDDASLKYVLMACCSFSENNELKREAMRTVRFVGGVPVHDEISAEDYIRKIFRIKTIRIHSEESRTLGDYKKFCGSFEYWYMFKTRRSIMRIMEASDLYERSGGGRARVGDLDEPPRRSVEQETLEYYAMGVDSADPFTAYISFYHVLEYYFDEVYKKNLIKELKNRITDPSFSYKSDKKLYDMAKWVGKKMKNDDANGRGNELESLKYVLEEYVPINRLLPALDEWNSSLKDYYQNNNVVFSGSKKDLIAWSDVNGVYTNISNRIYNTRNALVHSKSSQIDKQYKPKKHRAALVKELPLIQVIAELIIFQNGNVL